MAKYMVIKMDIDSGNLVEVTDENGNKAQQGSFAAGPMNAAKLGEILDMQSLTTMKTSASPDCRWIFQGGQWWWVCT